MLRYIPFYPLFVLLYLAVKNKGVHVLRLHLFLLYVLKVILLEVFRLPELLIFDWSIRNHKLKHAPVFIIGHWRSGTTHLQNMMRQDPETTSTDIYSSLFADNYFITGSWLKPLLNFILKKINAAYSIQRSKLDLNLPGELDTAMVSLYSTNAYTWGHLFAKCFEQYTSELVFFRGKKKPGDWISDYDYLIRKISLRSGNMRVIVKSPGDTARIQLLLSKYPDARFVFIHRNPVEVFLSTRYLWQVILKEYSLQKISAEETDRLVVSTYEKLLKSYLEQKRGIPPQQLIEIGYEELNQQPLDAIRKIYSHFGMPYEHEKQLQKFIGGNRNYHKVNYVTDTQTETLLRDKWRFAFEEWKY